MRIENRIIYDLYYDNKYIGRGTIPELAKKLGLQRRTLVNNKRRNSKYNFIKVDVNKEISRYDKKEYACYNGDEFLVIGTLHEIADYLGIEYTTLITYRSRKIHYIFVEV